MPDKNPIQHITDDIVQLRLKLPFALNHVNVYLLRGAEGWTIVDTGIHTPDGEAGWRDAFNALNFSPGDIEKIILTHVHPDHVGMAGWLQSLAKDAGRDVPVYASEQEDRQMSLVWRGESDMTESGKPEYKASFADWLIDNGMPDEFAQQVSNSMGDTHSMTLPHPPKLTLLDAGNTIQMGERTWEVIHAPGHSDGQLIFYDRADNLLLSGDHVLMKITPNIGLWRHSQPDPLGRFMSSLRELQDLNVRLALPGHRRLIENWQGRIDELIGHHETRLDFVREALATGATTTYEVTLHIFPTERFTAHEWRFAIAETLAHLAYLENVETS